MLRSTRGHTTEHAGEATTDGGDLPSAGCAGPARANEFQVSKPGHYGLLRIPDEPTAVKTTEPSFSFFCRLQTLFATSCPQQLTRNDAIDLIDAGCILATLHLPETFLRIGPSVQGRIRAERERGRLTTVSARVRGRPRTALVFPLKSAQVWLREHQKSDAMLAKEVVAHGGESGYFVLSPGTEGSNLLLDCMHELWKDTRKKEARRNVSASDIKHAVMAELRDQLSKTGGGP